MKGLKFIAVAIVLLTAFTACNDDNVYEEKWYVQDFEVVSSDWRLVGQPGEVGSYYEYVFDKVPLEVSYYQGIVTAYMYFNYKGNNEVQTPLPYTEYYVETNTANEEVNYSIQYSYDVMADGRIAFRAIVSDYYTQYFNPGTQYFRVAIIW